MRPFTAWHDTAADSPPTRTDYRGGVRETRGVTVTVPLIVVDAANVVGSRPDGWWRDRAGAARRLLTQLSEWAQRHDDPPGELAVVLEGAAKSATDPTNPQLTGLRIVLADGSGDDAIVDVVAAAADGDRSITVVTADRGLRHRVEALGATTGGPGWLRQHLP